MNEAFCSCLGMMPRHPLGPGDGDLHAHQLLAGAAEDDIDAEIPEHRDNGFVDLPPSPPPQREYQALLMSSV